MKKNIYQVYYNADTPNYDPYLPYDEEVTSYNRGMQILRDCLSCGNEHRRAYLTKNGEIIEVRDNRRRYERLQNS
jgi:hypothetical protein